MRDVGVTADGSSGHWPRTASTPSTTRIVSKLHRIVGTVSIRRGPGARALARLAGSIHHYPTLISQTAL